MKNTYQNPIVQLIFMDVQDVITTSGSVIMDNFMDFSKLKNVYE